MSPSPDLSTRVRMRGMSPSPDPSTRARMRARMRAWMRGTSPSRCQRQSGGSGSASSSEAATTAVGEAVDGGLVAAVFADDEGRAWDLGDRWACDDAGSADGERTLHQVWVR